MGRLPEPPRLMVASVEGEFFEHQTLLAMPVCEGERLPVDLGGPELFRISPSGTRLVALPGCRPVGWDPELQRTVRLEAVEREGLPREVWAAGAVLPPDWLCLRAPSAAPAPRPGCCEVGGFRGALLVAASDLQPSSRRDAPLYDTQDLAARVQRRLAGSPGNRVLRRMAHCALECACRLAQNFFYRRGEAFLTVSGGCDPERRGCAGLRCPRAGSSEKERPPSLARVEELVDLAAEHLRDVPDGVVTFGLGAAGDPHLAHERIERAILILRTRTPAGRLNLDAQIAWPSLIGRLFTAGLASIRVGLNSATLGRYERRYGPTGATFENLRGSLGVARGKGGRAFLGLEVVPGLSDRASELEALVRLVEEFRLDGVELRTGAEDATPGTRAFPAEDPSFGVGELLRRLRQRVPGLWLGTAGLPAPAGGAAAGSRRRPGAYRQTSRPR